MSDGNFIVPHEGENLMDWLDDIVYYYDGLCDQKETLATLAKSRERFRDYDNPWNELHQFRDSSALHLGWCSHFIIGFQHYQSG